MTVKFPIELKANTFYTSTELRETYDLIVAFIDGLAVPASAGGAKPTHRTTTRSWINMHTQSIYIRYAVS